MRERETPPADPAHLQTALQFDWLSRNQTHTDLDEIDITQYDERAYYQRYFSQTRHSHFFLAKKQNTAPGKI